MFSTASIWSPTSFSILLSLLSSTYNLQCHYLLSLPHAFLIFCAIKDTPFKDNFQWSLPILFFLKKRMLCRHFASYLFSFVFFKAHLCRHTVEDTTRREPHSASCTCAHRTTRNKLFGYTHTAQRERSASEQPEGHGRVLSLGNLFKAVL